jgi:hypothetical protein
MLREWGVTYVEARAISAAVAHEYGIDETGPDPELINTRLNFRSSHEQIRKAFAEVKSLVWFPLFRSDGVSSYVARVNGIYRDQEGIEVKFLYSKSGRRVPWIPAPTMAVAKDVDKPLILTEGYFKAGAILHAGGLPIGFNGPWIDEKTPEQEKEKSNNRVLVAELGALRWKSRRVYFAFDLDQASNNQVRHAVIRDWILLKIQGAEVFQLQWDKQDKGLEDHLARLCGTDPVKQKEVLARVLAEGKPFFEVLVKSPGGDARLVRKELHSVKMDVTDREALAKEAASPLGVTKASLLSTDGAKTPRSNRQVVFHDPEPWDQPVNGNELLAELIALIHKHVYLSGDDALTIALWIIWTYLVDQPYAEVSPYLGITSPDKRCAKTRLLDLIERLVRRGYGASDITKSSFFRFVETHRPTLCLDEFHKLIKNRSELLQPFLNAYSRNKYVLVTNTETMETEQFDIWGARAIAYLGELDDQFKDRVIAINLERKPRSIRKAKLRDTPVEETELLRRKLVRWAADNAEGVGAALVPVFETDNDREADNWETLFQIAAVFDPENVEAVVRVAVTKEKSVLAERESEQSAVFGAIRDIYLAVGRENNLTFDETKSNFFLSLKTLCSILNKDPEGVWQDWRWGKEYGAYERKISQIIQSYTGKKPTRSKDEIDTNLTEQPTLTTDVRGYHFRDLWEAFERYK